MSRWDLPPRAAACSVHWSSPAFADELQTFVEDAVGPARLEREKLRPWSTVWRASAGDGRRFWAKQNAPASWFEAGLLLLLGELAPDHVLPVTAADVATGLFLTPDQGDVLGFEHADLATWERIVREWAQLQRRLLTDADAITATGVDTLSVADSLPLLEHRLALLRGLPPTDPRRLAEPDAAKVETSLPVVREAVDVVGALGLPVALNHNDLHGNNVFAVQGDLPLRFFDLGDAMLTDPTAVLMVPLGGVADVLGCPADDTRLWQVANAWVEVWDDLAPAASLRAALPHAMRLARLTRHEAWVRLAPSMSDQELADWDAGAPWLGTVPDPPLLAAQ